MKVNERGAGGDYRIEALAAEAEEFLRRNPWVAVTGAAVLSGVLGVLNGGKPFRKNSSRAALRDWLEEARGSMPTKKQFRSAAESAGVPTSLAQLKRKLGEN